MQPWFRAGKLLRIFEQNLPLDGFRRRELAERDDGLRALAFCAASAFVGVVSGSVSFSLS